MVLRRESADNPEIRPRKMSVFKGKACAFGCLEHENREGHYKLEFAKLVNAFVAARVLAPAT